MGVFILKSENPRRFCRCGFFKFMNYVIGGADKVSVGQFFRSDNLRLYDENLPEKREFLLEFDVHHFHIWSRFAV